ncbi:MULTISPECIES: tetraacyldisaccharide 4'-kinase [Halocynthiibacter]|uniref:Tetraacyldisaccharide 4'-kinase n=1 Tax=Halocynthiibacter halioticoli TaxID=2986804 RepID=A0AAE3LRK4_9RHOB|nr:MULTISPECIES: tetraacyldisaccharide 4'-kinase [Halocynthiibacter]MCV6825687.1 tetraacyldisaccharide 4'-kinase [Halocynthiibacter halioticoli]MCW4058688.1 tetraacyldisaccharide 4'-kinase [Halocynthiibacter sp. SDUM655004]
MRSPRFWYHPKPNALRDMALAPLGRIYAKGTARRLASERGYRPDVPVICVGNINVGGTGKTPTTIAIIQHLQSRGKTPVVVSRGYGGSLEGPIRVDPIAHSADQVGDEPLLISAFCDCVIGKDRAAGAQLAQSLGADVIVLDDGFQNPAVQKDLSIVVVDARLGFGNGKVLPAGPLREPLHVGLLRADFVLSIGDSENQAAFDKKWAHTIECPHLRGHLDVLQMGMSFEGLRVLAFAGIAHPEKFFTTLKNEGAELLRCESLADHQPLSETLMKRLELEADSLGAQLVTTEKDAARLPEDFRPKVLTLPVRLKIKDTSALDAELAKFSL